MLFDLNWSLLTQQTGHNGYQSCSCSQLQHRLPLQVHPLPVVVQEGAQSQRLQERDIQSSHDGLLMLLLIQPCNVFMATHCGPHHRSKRVNGLINEDVLPYVMVDIFIKAFCDAGHPGWVLHSCLFDMLLSCEKRIHGNFNRGETVQTNTYVCIL